MIKLDIQMFASTNKTANYELPQFVGTDKPTWLGDFNGAMASIDAGMHENAVAIDDLSTDVDTATSTASQASQDVSNLTSTVSTLSSSVTSATATANNAQSTATSALNTANTANSKADANTTAISGLDRRVDATESEISKFNFTNIKKSTLTKSGGTFTVSSSNEITVATNSDGSIAKIYGQIHATNVTANGLVVASSDLRPSEDLTIQGVAIRSTSRDGNIKNISYDNIVIRTNGNIEFRIVWTNASGDACRVIPIACLLFIKDFGDTPVPDGE